MGSEHQPEPPASQTPQVAGGARSRRLLRFALVASLSFNITLLGLWMSGRSHRSDQATDQRAAPAWAPTDPATSDRYAEFDSAGLLAQVNPTSGYQLPAQYQDLGPALIRAGAIDPDRFMQVYRDAGRPLTEGQLAAALDGSDAPVVFDHGSSYFLLNLFWALGLVNQSPILQQGPLISNSQGDIGRFASTGGWTLGRRPASELYSSASILPLNPQQHAVVERVAGQVYRPCCDNHAGYPDCNHGMAMLGMLQLLASQGASDAQMLEAAKYANAFWFPQQAMEVAAFFRVTQSLSFDQVPGEQAVGRALFSSSGSGQLHSWLADNRLLQESPRQGGSCGV